MSKLFPNGFKNSGLASLIKGGARIADKTFTSGLIFNVIDKNGAEKGTLDVNKATRGIVLWIPFILVALRLLGIIDQAGADALNEAIP